MFWVVYACYRIILEQCVLCSPAGNGSAIKWLGKIVQAIILNLELQVVSKTLICKYVYFLFSKKYNTTTVAANLTFVFFTLCICMVSFAHKLIKYAQSYYRS